jgi:hypothetical protein
LLRQQVYQEPDSFHPVAKWSPVTLPLKGVYDDYGGIKEVVEDNVVKFQVECLARHARVNPRAREDDAKEYRGNLNNLQTILDCCERGLLELAYTRTDLKDLKPGEDIDDSRRVVRATHVVPMFVHEQVYQEIVHGWGGHQIGGRDWRKILSEDGNGTEGSRLRQYMEIAMEKDSRKSSGLSEADEIMEKHAIDLKALYAGMVIRNGMGAFESWPDVFAVGGKWKEDWDSYGMLKEFTDEDWDSFLEREMDLLTFFYVMSRELRRPLQPCLFTDQFYNKDLLGPQMMFAGFLLRWADHYEAKLKERFEWDEDEDE